MIAEVVGGVISGSLALLADAGHMLSDVAAVALSLFAIWIAHRPAPPQKTFGYHRAEILAALANGVSLTVVAVLILMESYHRLRDPHEVDAPTMMAIAVGGLIVNLVALSILHGGREASLNLKGAWLHVLFDTLGSVGVILAGVALWAFGWTWFDPTASAVIAVLIVYSSWRLLTEAVDVLMQAAPRHIRVEEVRAAMIATPDVLDVHDLHIWTITTGLNALSAHVVLETGAQDHETLSGLRHMLFEKFGIDHLTLQIEPTGFLEKASGI